MADVDVSAISGGGLPSLGDLTAKLTDFKTIGMTQLAILNGGSALTTVLNITNRSAIDSLWIESSAGSLTLPQVRITIDGVVRFDSNVNVASGKAMFFIGQGVTGHYSLDQKSVSVTGGTYGFSTILVEIDSTGEANQLQMYGNIQGLA